MLAKPNNQTVDFLLGGESWCVKPKLAQPEEQFGLEDPKMGDCAVTNCKMPATRLLEVSGEGLSFDGGKIHVPNASMEIGAYVCDSHELKDTPWGFRA